jgi:nucleotide-binding universal stress UspA family protein
MAFKKILVPMDFSEYSDQAVEYAMFLADKFCASITLLHTVVLHEEDINEDEYLKAYQQIIQQKENERSKRIQSVCTRGKDRGLQVDSVLLRGVNAHGSILAHISDNDYDLVVMGTHGRTGLSRWFSGSVAGKVVRESPIPVITVHRDLSHLRIQKILVPIDFSKHSPYAVKTAKKVAKEFKAQLVFLHVVEMESHPEFYNISSNPILQENPALKDHILKNLKELAGMNDATYDVSEGSVNKKIKSYAEENDIDLIILPARGMNDLEHFFLGSNTEKVVAIAPCPVLTIR